MKLNKHVLKLHLPKKRLSDIETSSNSNKSDKSERDNNSMFRFGDAQLHVFFRNVFDVVADGMCIIDTDFNIVQMSRLLQDSLQLDGDSETLRKCYDVVGGSECNTPRCPLHASRESVTSLQMEVVRGFGKDKNYILSSFPLCSPDGTIVGIVEHFRDITEQTKARDQLAADQETLRAQMREIDQKNAALNELLGKIEHGREEMANQVRDNLDHMVFPILETIREHIDPAKGNLVSVVASCLDDITGSYVTMLRQQNGKLSAAEMEICSMIREGFTTKQIASLRGVSAATVIDQRKTIRKKLGIAKTDTNLTTYLKSSQQRASN